MSKKASRRDFIRRLAVSAGLTGALLGGVGNVVRPAEAQVEAASSKATVKTLFAMSSITTVANTTTETSTIGSGVGSRTLAANFFSPGRTIRITIRGTVENSEEESWVTVRLKLGTTVVFSGLANGSNRYADEVVITCLEAGTSGTIIGNGTGGIFFPAVTFPIYIDTKNPLVFDLTAQITYFDSDTAITLVTTNVVVEALN
jgi:hypothetical protein